MSYENPKLYGADSQAFSRGFESTFGKFTEMFEAERKERERLEKETEETLTKAYSASSLDDVKGLDSRLIGDFQKSIDQIIENGDFKNASASEQTKILRNVSLTKNNISRLGELAAIDPKDWDNRNSPKLTALRNSLIRGDKNLKITGSGLDLSIVGDFGEVSLSELSSSRFMKKSDYSDVFQDFNNDFQNIANQIYAKNASAGIDVEQTKSQLEQIYKTKFNALDDELKSYVYSNELPKDVQSNYNSFTFGDYSGTSGKDVLTIKKEQNQGMIDYFSNSVLGQTYDYLGISQKVQEKEAKEEKEKAQARYTQIRLAQISKEEALQKQLFGMLNLTKDEQKLLSDKSNKVLQISQIQDSIKNNTSLLATAENVPGDLRKLGFIVELDRDEKTKELVGYTIKYDKNNVKISREIDLNQIQGKGYRDDLLNILKEELDIANNTQYAFEQDYINAAMRLGFTPDTSPF